MKDICDYMHGFCKSAHSAGLDQVSIVKKAAPFSGSWIGDKAGRFISLLLGSPAVRGPVLKNVKKSVKELRSLKETYAKGMKQGLMKGSNRVAWDKARANYYDAIRRGVPANTEEFAKYRDAYDLARKMARGRGHMRRLGGEIANLESDIARQMQPIRAETWKVRGARLGAGAAAVGGVGLYANATENKEA